MPRKSPFLIQLTAEERRELESAARQYTSPYCDVVRAKIVLLAAEGLGNDVIAGRLDLPRQIVSKWRKRFCLWRLPGLAAEPRGGRPSRGNRNPHAGRLVEVYFTSKQFPGHVLGMSYDTYFGLRASASAMPSTVSPGCSNAR